MNENYIEEWREAGQPLPTSAIQVKTGTCDYDCEAPAEYLVKIENDTGATAKFRVCKSCNKENYVWAERHLPEDSEATA